LQNSKKGPTTIGKRHFDDIKIDKNPKYGKNPIYGKMEGIRKFK